MEVGITNHARLPITASINTCISDTLITCAPNQWRHGKSSGPVDERPAANVSEQSLQLGPIIETYEIMSWPTGHSIGSPGSGPDSVRATVGMHHPNPKGALSGPNSLEYPLSVHQKVLRHLQQTARKPIASLYDLAGLIAGCCASTFDETQVPDEYQFLDFFENSISIVVSFPVL